MKTATTSSGVTRRGFGPADLLDGLRRAKWEPCIPSGRNFDGMELGGYCLTDTPDDRCGARFRVTARNTRTGDAFVIDGYGYPFLMTSFAIGKEKTAFLGKPLTKTPSRDRRTYYEVTVEPGPDPANN